MKMFKIFGIVVLFLYIPFLVSCGSTASFHQEALQTRSAAISSGDLARAFSLPTASIVEFKYFLKDGSVEIVNIYPQKKGVITDEDIKEPSEKVIDQARANNVSVNPKEGYMLDYVIINSNGTYACPFPKTGGDKNTYQATTNVSVFYGHDNMVKDPADAVVQTVLSPLALALTILGEKPSNYTLQLSQERVNIIGKAVEADTINYLKDRVNNSRSPEELMTIYRVYHNLPGIQTAVSRARELDPTYVSSALPVANTEIAAAERIVRSNVPESERSAAVAAEVEDWQQELLNEKFDMQLSANNMDPSANTRRQTGEHQYIFHYQDMVQDAVIHMKLRGRPNNGIKYPAKIAVRYRMTVPVKNITRKAFLGIDFHQDDIDEYEEVRHYTLKSKDDMINDRVTFKMDVASSAKVLTIQQDKVLNGDPELTVDVVEVSN